MVELARAFKSMEGKNKRTIVFVAFDAEEQHDMGSMYLALNPIAPIAAGNKNVAFVSSIDMIGLDYDAWLTMADTAKAKYVDDWFVKAYNGTCYGDDDGYSLDICGYSGSGATQDYDTGAYAVQKIPTRMFGLYNGKLGKKTYHKPGDVFGTVNFGG